jgi:hypothetical protein
LTYKEKGDIMDKVKIEHHIKHLEEQHRSIDNLIKDSVKHYGNDTEVAGLKKKKLKLKDEIEGFKKQIA